VPLFVAATVLAQLDEVHVGGAATTTSTLMLSTSYAAVIFAAFATGASVPPYFHNRSLTTKLQSGARALRCRLRSTRCIRLRQSARFASTVQL
jgi:hypothetical protein